jgi:hypothetical protein
MNYTRFINSLSLFPEHHGKFLLHHLNPKSFDNEELRLYRFADFIKYVRKDLLLYENFSLIPDELYTFQLFIHTPEHHKYLNNIRQHSTTMSIMYRIVGGLNHVNEILNRSVKVYCNSSVYSAYISDISELFKFNDNEIIKMIEKDIDDEYVLKIYTSNNIPWFNFSTNSITPTDVWKVPQSILSTTHHSLSYIMNDGLYYKFPDDKSDQSILFNVYIHDNMIYHKCMTSIDDSLKIEHYNNRCCISSVSSFIKPFVENIDYIVRTIRHYYLARDKELKETSAKFNTLNHICKIQYYSRMKFMNQLESIYLMNYIDSQSNAFN